MPSLWHLSKIKVAPVSVTVVLNFHDRYSEGGLGLLVSCLVGAVKGATEAVK